VRSLDISWERAKILRDWRRYVDRIARSVKKILGDDARVYVFGSAVRGELTAISDIDILVVSKRVPRSFMERVKLKLKIMDSSSLPDHGPFELHLVDEREAKLYFYHIKGDYVRVA